MSDETQPYPYKAPSDIFARHGLIVFILYYVTEVASWASVGHWLRYLPRKIPWLGFALDANFNTVKAWWQDTVVLALLLLTPLAGSIACDPQPASAYAGRFLSIYLLFDAVIYDIRVLWFDDLKPGLPKYRRGVWSHRRILFLATFGYAQSIILFPSLYQQVPNLSTSSHTSLLERSFSTATLLSLNSPLTSVDVIQVAVSLFFLAIVIATTASIAYHRQEFSEGDRNC